MVMWHIEGSDITILVCRLCWQLLMACQSVYKKTAHQSELFFIMLFWYAYFLPNENFIGVFNNFSVGFKYLRVFGAIA